MNHTTNPITVRIEWCRRQSAKARTEPEVDGWSAEADGLRDALMKSDHTSTYRQCPPEILRRYVLGFQDGTALLQAAQVQHVRAAATETSQPDPRRGKDILLGDER